MAFVYAFPPPFDTTYVDDTFSRPQHHHFPLHDTRRRLSHGLENVSLSRTVKYNGTLILTQTPVVQTVRNNLPHPPRRRPRNKKSILRRHRTSRPPHHQRPIAEMDQREDTPRIRRNKAPGGS